jgi:hypothetical protein
VLGSRSSSRRSPASPILRSSGGRPAPFLCTLSARGNRSEQGRGEPPARRAGAPVAGAVQGCARVMMADVWRSRGRPDPERGARVPPWCPRRLLLPRIEAGAGALADRAAAASGSTAATRLEDSAGGGSKAGRRRRALGGSSMVTARRGATSRLPPLRRQQAGRRRAAHLFLCAGHLPHSRRSLSSRADSLHRTARQRICGGAVRLGICGGRRSHSGEARMARRRWHRSSGFRAVVRCNVKKEELRVTSPQC